MKVNWFIVIAQIINFLILVWLLKRYLYKPILNAVEEREKKIISQLKDAEAQKSEAKKEKDEFLQKNDEFNKQREDLMNKAISESNEERQKLLKEARDAAKTLQIELEKALNENLENLTLEISQNIQKEVFAMAKKTLTDIASVSLEEQSVSIFLKHLKNLKEKEEKQFIDAFQSGSNSILIRSAFDLSKTLQTEIKKSVTEILGIDSNFEFKTSSELINGIELSSNGYKLSWSVLEYINSLQKDFSETLKEKLNKIPKENKS